MHRARGKETFLTPVQVLSSSENRSVLFVAVLFLFFIFVIVTAPVAAAKAEAQKDANQDEGANGTGETAYNGLLAGVWHADHV